MFVALWYLFSRRMFGFQNISNYKDISLLDQCEFGYSSRNWSRMVHVH